MFQAQNHSCSNKTVSSSPSQGNSNVALLTTVRHLILFRLRCGLRSPWTPNLLATVSGMYYKNVSTTAPRLTVWSTWNSTSWLNGQLSIIASSRWPMLSGVCDCLLIFALPVKILSIVCSDIIHSSCQKYWLTPIGFIFVKFIRLSFALSKNYDSLDKFLGNLEYFKFAKWRLFILFNLKELNSQLYSA